MSLIVTECGFYSDIINEACEVLIFSATLLENETEVSANYQVKSQLF